jgi:hypothetical protein
LLEIPSLGRGAAGRAQTQGGVYPPYQVAETPPSTLPMGGNRRKELMNAIKKQIITFIIAQGHGFFSPVCHLIGYYYGKALKPKEIPIR